MFGNCNRGWSDAYSKIKISELKKAFKNTIVSMYIMISFLRKKVKWLNQYSMTMDDVFHSNELSAFLGKDYIKNLKESFIKMIYYWDRIELLLKENDILLSTRSQAVFSRENLDDMLYEKYNQKHLIDNILSSINDLNTMIFRGWGIINEK